MKKIITISILSFLFFNCQNIDNRNELKVEIESLQQKNDSLVSILNELNDKYIFDSLTIRQIPHYTNTDKLNSIHRQEFVFVGYNSNEKSYVIIGDSLNFDDGLKVINGDTLRKSVRGGFKHELRLTNDKNYYVGVLKAENEFGKPYEIIFKSIIQTKEDK